MPDPLFSITSSYLLQALRQRQCSSMTLRRRSGYFVDPLILKTGHRPVTVLGSPDHCMRRYSLRPSRAARSRVSGFVLWHESDIARSRMDVHFREKSGRAADITGTTEFGPDSDIGQNFM